VLVVEGEKTADAAQRHFPDYVAVTWPGGSNATAKADWGVLVGRRIVLWPDADGPGRKAAAEVARLVASAGAASVVEVAAAYRTAGTSPTRCLNNSGFPSCWLQRARSRLMSRCQPATR
jgi:DNA primase